METSEVERAEEALAEAMRAGDIETLDRLLHPRLVFTHHLGGRIGKADDLGAHRAGAVDITRLELSERHIELYGRTAVVSVRADIAGVFGGAPSEAALRFMRVWHDDGTGPRVIAAQSTAIAPGTVTEPG